MIVTISQHGNDINNGKTPLLLLVVPNGPNLPFLK